MNMMSGGSTTTSTLGPSHRPVPVLLPADVVLVAPSVVAGDDDPLAVAVIGAPVVIASVDVPVGAIVVPALVSSPTSLSPSSGGT